MTIVDIMCILLLSPIIIFVWVFAIALLLHVIETAREEIRRNK